MRQDQEDEVLYFEPSAYLQRLLGRELISNEYIAVAELVKNAYDAGATEVIIELEKGPPQKLVISDNGLGMSLREFKRLWMVPGYSEKVESDKPPERPFLGEKGIGRFAADRLARKLTVVTKKVSEGDALYVEFDWDDFDDRKKKMHDVPVPYSRRPNPILRKYHSGTRLELEGLRKEWSREDWRELRKELQNLVSPVSPIRGFKITTKAEEWESGEISSPFEADEGHKYTFTLSKKGHLTRKLTRPRRVAKKLRKQKDEIERKFIGTKSFGTFKGSFYYVDRPRTLTKLGFERGVGIYRDGFRVEPYGRENNDWLEVKAWKAKRHGHAPINPSRLFGFIEITRHDNPALKDVTNREGLLDTPEFADFRAFVMEEFRQFAEIVEKEKESIESESKAYKAQRAKAAQTIRQTTFAEIASQLAHQLRQPLEVIGLEAGTLETWLKKRQLLDEDVLKATRSIKRGVDNIHSHITLMRKRAQSSRAPVVEFDVCDWIRERMESFEQQANAQGITMHLQGCREKFAVTFSQEALGFVLDNFLQNALNAVANTDSRPKEIVVLVEQPRGTACRITVQDTGNGVPVEYRERLLREAVPSQTGGTGFGLLYSCDVIEENGGDIGFESLHPFGSSFYVEFKNQEIKDE